MGVVMDYVRIVVGLESLGLDVLVRGESRTVWLMGHVPLHRLWRRELLAIANILVSST